MLKELYLGSLCGLCLININIGTEKLIEFLNQREAVEQKIYAKAETITPEIIRTAQETSEKTVDRKYGYADGRMFFLLAGFCGYLAYTRCREEERKNVRREEKRCL